MGADFLEAQRRPSLCRLKLDVIKHPLEAVGSTVEMWKQFDPRVEVGGGCICCVWGFRVSAVSPTSRDALRHAILLNGSSVGKQDLISVLLLAGCEAIRANCKCCVCCLLQLLEMCVSCRKDGWSKLEGRGFKNSSLKHCASSQSLKPLISSVRSLNKGDSEAEIRVKRCAIIPTLKTILNAF